MRACTILALVVVFGLVPARARAQPADAAFMADVLKVDAFLADGTLPPGDQAELTSVAGRFLAARADQPALRRGAADLAAKTQAAPDALSRAVLRERLWRGEMAAARSDGLAAAERDILTRQPGVLASDGEHVLSQSSAAAFLAARNLVAEAAGQPTLSRDEMLASMARMKAEFASYKPDDRAALAEGATRWQALRRAWSDPAFRARYAPLIKAKAQGGLDLNSLTGAAEQVALHPEAATAGDGTVCRTADCRLAHNPMNWMVLNALRAGRP